MALYAKKFLTFALVVQARYSSTVNATRPFAMLPWILNVLIRISVVFNVVLQSLFQQLVVSRAKYVLPIYNWNAINQNSAPMEQKSTNPKNYLSFL